MFAAIAMAHGSLLLQERDGQILQSRTAICQEDSGDGPLKFMGTLRPVTPRHQSIEHALNGMVYGLFTEHFSCGGSIWMVPTMAWRSSKRPGESATVRVECRTNSAKFWYRRRKAVLEAHKISHQSSCFHAQ